MERFGMRAHVSIYPGGGLFPGTAPSLLAEIGRRCATVFTSAPEVMDAVPGTVPTEVPVPGAYYTCRQHHDAEQVRLVFVGDDRPRKGLVTLLDAMARLGPGFRLDVVGPHERHADRLATAGARCHGWLSPKRLREVLWECDVVVSPATRDLPEDGYGDTGVVDGFPTTAARVAMLAGCCLVGSNPLSDHTLLRPGQEYVEVPERDPAALVDALESLSADSERRRSIAARGARVVRERCDAAVVVAAKLAAMGLG
jgi:glycosyltransferase involved in cell wall biosynthesis